MERWRDEGHRTTGAQPGKEAPAGLGLNRSGLTALHGKPSQGLAARTKRIGTTVEPETLVRVLIHAEGQAAEGGQRGNGITVASQANGQRDCAQRRSARALIVFEPIRMQKG